MTPRIWSLALAAAAVMSVTGCSKSADMTAYPMTEPVAYGDELPPAQTVDITRNAAYDFEGDLADGGGDLADSGALDRSVLASPPPGSSGAAMRFEAPPARDAKGKANKEAQAQAERAAAKAAEGGEPAIASDEDQTPDHGRQIIYVAGLQISVYSLDQAMSAVEALPDRYGGWVHMRTQNQLVLRLPAAKLQPAMLELAKMGVVEARTLQAQDVSAEYVDLESRIRVLRETQTQLLDLLAKAKTVEEALHVRTALDNVTMELEVALGRMRQLGDMIEFSTLTVTLIERGPQDSIPTSNDPFRWVDSLGVEATEWR